RGHSLLLHPEFVADPDSLELRPANETRAASYERVALVVVGPNLVDVVPEKVQRRVDVDHVRADVENHQDDEENCHPSGASGVLDVETEEREYVSENVRDYLRILALDRLDLEWHRLRPLDPADEQ